MELQLRNGQEKTKDDHGTSKGDSVQIQSISPGGYIKSNYRLYIKRTICLCLCYFCLGMHLAEGGSTFLDQLILVNSDVEEGSILFTSLAAGYCFGCVVAGVLYDRWNRDGLLFLSAFFIGALNIAGIWCPSLWSMSIIAAIRGIALGMLDTGCNSVCLWMWKEDGGPYLQAMHTSLSIGGVITPFISDPFLASNSNTTHNSTVRQFNVTRYTDNGPGVGNNTSYITLYNTTNVERYMDTETSVHFAFEIIGAICIVCSLPFLVLYCLRSRLKESPESNKLDEKETKDETASIETSAYPTLSLPEKVIFLSLICLFNVFYICLEAGIEGYILTFVVAYLDWSKSDGSRITSVFWGTFVAGRLLGILVSKYLTPWKMLFIDLVLVISILAPLCFLTRDNDVMVWVCIPLSGVCMATIFPTAINWTDRDIMRVTAKIAAIFIFSSASGFIFLPMLLGYLFKNFSPMWFIYLVVIEAGICFVIFITLTLLLKVHKRENRVFVISSREIERKY